FVMFRQFTMENNVDNVILSLGSNLGHSKAVLLDASATIRAQWGPTCISNIVVSPPWGPIKNQPPFLNLSLSFSTNREPHALLEDIMEIERRFGRDRTHGPPARYGPRTLDIDIIYFGTH